MPLAKSTPVCRPMISVIINAHTEGRLIHRTARSVLNAMRYAEEHGLSCEALAVLDTPDSETEAYFRDHADDFSRVETVSYRDLGSSRNHGVACARGTYIAFVDGDDLLCHDWLVKAYRFVSTSPDEDRLIAHTQYFLGFGADHFLRLQVDSDESDFNPFDLISNWFFCNNIFAKRSIYQLLQFEKSDHSSGFGAEDWHLSCESLAKGYVHRAVPETVYFYRRHNDRVSLGSKPNITIRPTALFDLSRRLPTATIRPSKPSNLPGPPSEPTPSPLQGFPHSPLKRVYFQIRDITKATIGRVHYPTYDWLSTMGRATKNYYKCLVTPTRPSPSERQSRLPDWLLRAWREAHTVEPLLFPLPHIVDSVPIFRPETRTRVAELYPSLWGAFGKDNPQLVVLAPWLKHGGADRLTIYYLRALLKKLPDLQITLITTENADSPLLNELPPSVNVMEFGKAHGNSLSIDDQIKLLLRLLLQRPASMVWNINSYLGYELFTRYGRALAEYSKLAACAFGPGMDQYGRHCGYPFSHLSKCIGQLSAVLTDNHAIVDLICETYDLDASKFKVVYAPADLAGPRAATQTLPEAKLRVLWAGRIDLDKRPDLLLKIVEQAEAQGKNMQFDIFGSAVLSDGPEGALEKLKAHASVRYRGPFSSFNQLPVQDYQAFLYTSQADGMPNVLLEAGGAGIPIIASSVGGVPELINPETGYLVSSIEEPAAYLAALEEVAKAPAQAKLRSVRLKELIEIRHSWTAFETALEKAILPLIRPEQVNGVRPSQTICI